MNVQQLRFRQKTIHYLLCSFIVFFIYACNSDDNQDSKQHDEVVSETIELGMSMKNIQLIAQQPIEIKFSYIHPEKDASDGPSSTTARGGYSINIAQTLQNVTLSSTTVAKSPIFEAIKLAASALVSNAFANEAATAQVSIFLSVLGDPNVCSSSIRLGPYSVSGMLDSALSSEEADIIPQGTVRDITNSGGVEVCIVTIPPIDAYFTLSGIVVDVEPCDEPSVDIANTSWSGTFVCENFGTGDDPESQISLTITQNPDGSYKYIDDGDGEYNGHLCGNKFNFKGALAGSYTESGTLVFETATQATKTSMWNGIPRGSSGGKCTDSLQKIE